MKKIIIFGAGSFGRNFYDLNKDNFHVLAFIDNNKKIQGLHIDIIQILPPEKIYLLEFDEVVIASMYAVQIRGQLLKEILIPEEKISIPLKLNNFPFLNLPNKMLAEKLVSKITEISIQVSARIWIDFGTLLGIYRNKSILEWDSDVDFGFYKADLKKLLRMFDLLVIYLKKELPIKYNLKQIKKEKDIIQIILEISPINDKSFTIEFCSYNLNSKGFLINELHPKWIKGIEIKEVLPIKFSRNISENIQQIPFPNNTKKYVENIYGDDWFIERKDWSYTDYNA